MGILFIFLKKKDFKENSHVKVHFFFASFGCLFWDSVNFI